MFDHFPLGLDDPALELGTSIAQHSRTLCLHPTSWWTGFPPLRPLPVRAAFSRRVSGCQVTLTSPPSVDAFHFVLDVFGSELPEPEMATGRDASFDLSSACAE